MNKISESIADQKTSRLPWRHHGVLGRSWLVILAGLFLSAALAAAPNTFRFQGRLTDNHGFPVIGDEVKVRFALYSSPSGGAPLWEVSADQTVATNEAGLFATDIGPLPSNLFANTPALYLQVSVYDGATIKPLAPRQKLTSVPYSFYADSANAAVTATYVPDNSITSLNIQTGAVESRHIKDGSVTHLKLATNSITSANIIDSGIDRDKINSASFDPPGSGLIPQNAVLMFVDRHTCPAGFSEVEAFRNRLPIGADLGGASSLVPDLPGEPAGASHTHVIRNGGRHAHSTHTGGANIFATRVTDVLFPQDDEFLQDTGNDILRRWGKHNHVITEQGDHNHIAEAEPVIPPSLTVLFCRKN